MWSCGQHSTYKGRWWRIKEKASKVFKLYIVQTCGNRIMVIMNDNDNDMIIMQTCTQVDNKLGPRKVPASLRGAGGRKVFSGNHPFSPFPVSSLERCSRKMTHHLCFLIHICLCNAPVILSVFWNHLCSFKVRSQAASRNSQVSSVNWRLVSYQKP